MEHNLLVAARSEYTEKLQDTLSESIYEGLKDIWISSKVNKRSPLSEFQKKLCDVPKWNQDVIDNLCKKIIENSDISYEYLDKIIEAVFLSNVKILSVVKLNDEKQTIDITVPDTKNFIHRCYIESARRLYMDPYLIDDRESGSNTKHEIKRNVKRSIATVKDSVEKTIRSMIPMEDILTKYLASTGGESKMSSTSSDSEETPETYSEPEESIHFEDLPSESPVTPQPSILASSQVQELNLTEQGVDSTVDDLFQKEPYDNTEIMEEPETQEDKLHIDLKEPEKHFYSDSD